MSDSALHIGIDLGTTNSCVGVYRHAGTFDGQMAGSVEVLPNEMNNRTTASVVAFTDAGVVVGDGAKRSIANNAKNTICAIKRIIGQPFDSDVVRAQVKDYEYDVVSNDGKAACRVEIQGANTIQTPEQISSLILKKMKDIVERDRGTSVASAVVTVPAYFSDAQRAATMKAGELAGIHVSSIINEPVAAAIAFGVQERKKREFDGDETVLVFDLGGGTFDVTVLSTDGKRFNVRTHGGDMRLGGENFDTLIMEELLRRFEVENGSGKADISPRSLIRLRKECEKAKQELSCSGTTETDVEVPGFHNGVDLYYELTRNEFENACESLFQKSIQVVSDMLDAVSISKDSVDQVLLVGGSSQIPRVRELVQNFFGSTSDVVRSDISHSEAIAIGATLKAAALASQGVEEQDDSLVELFDVSAHSLGIAIRGSVMSIVLPKNSALPSSAEGSYTNMEHGKRVRISVFQGEDRRVCNNTLLDEFTIVGTKEVPANTMDITVTFKLTENGILHVSAVERSQGINRSVEIKRAVW